MEPLLVVPFVGALLVLVATWYFSRFHDGEAAYRSFSEQQDLAPGAHPDDVAQWR